MIISFQQLKGGAGKTTLALNVAAVLAVELGARVLFVDSDPQGSALDWSHARQREPLFPVIGLPKPTIHKELAVMAKDYDHVVIDTPPRLSDSARSALMVADLAVLPTTPSQYDIWALSEIVNLVKDAQTFKPDLRSSIVINRRINGTVIGRETTAALHEVDFPVFRTAVTHRVLFAEMAGTGRAVIEMEPKGPAAREIRDLTTEIMQLLGILPVDQLAPVAPEEQVTKPEEAAERQEGVA